MQFWREAMVQWLRQMAFDQEVMGSNPDTIYWMEVSDFLASYYIKEKLKIQVAKWGTIKKVFKKTYHARKLRQTYNIEVSHSMSPLSLIMTSYKTDSKP